MFANFLVQCNTLSQNLSISVIFLVVYIYMFGSGKDLSIALALVISLFKVVTRVSLGRILMELIFCSRDTDNMGPFIWYVSIISYNPFAETRFPDWLLMFVSQNDKFFTRLFVVCRIYSKDASS